MTSIMVNGNETTGNIAERTADVSKHETTGGVGFRTNAAIYQDNGLKCDTVSFSGKGEKKKKSAGSVIFRLLVAAAAVVGGMGILHKNVNKIGSEKIRNIVKKAECVTEPCYKACSWVKKNCYDKVFHRK